MQTVLIDTDIAIDFLRGIAKARDIILPLWERDIAFISFLTAYELYAGMQAKEKEATEGKNIILIKKNPNLAALADEIDKF